MKDTKPNAFKYRIAYNCWLNDVRMEPLPLQNWPAPQFDEETVDSIIKAIEVQSAAGFNMVDIWGYFATFAYPPDIVSAFSEKERLSKVKKVLKAARGRGMAPVFGLGTYSWGYDRIIEADPSVRGKNQDGSPHPHAMCNANPKSFEYVKKIIDCVLSEFDFGGVHLESCDLGCCWCPECAGKDGVVGYNCRINATTADYIKSKWPDKIVYSITINWLPPGKHFNEEEKAHIIELSKHIDCLMDQGHNGYHLDPKERREFIRKMHCEYGTSGGIWLYPDVRWDRSSYFLPYPKRAAKAIKELYEDGGRGCLLYQGPMNNPGVELTIACSGRILSDTSRNIEDVMAEVIALYYKPKNSSAHKKLAEMFQRAEEAYFSGWSEPARQAELINFYGAVPGELKLDVALFGTSPGPATYLMEPNLDTDGRHEYKKALVSILEELPKIEPHLDDKGRIQRIRRGIIITLNFLNTVAACKDERI